MIFFLCVFSLNKAITGHCWMHLCASHLLQNIFICRFRSSASAPSDLISELNLITFLLALEMPEMMHLCGYEGGQGMGYDPESRDSIWFEFFMFHSPWKTINFQLAKIKWRSEREKTARTTRTKWQRIKRWRQLDINVVSGSRFPVSGYIDASQPAAARSKWNYSEYN